MEVGSRNFLVHFTWEWTLTRFTFSKVTAGFGAPAISQDSPISQQFRVGMLPASYEKAIAIIGKQIDG